MLNKIFSFGALHCAFFSSVLSSAILSNGESRGHTTAIVVFDVIDHETGDSEKLGSVDPHDEIGKYGITSPKENISGIVFTAVKDSSNHIFGCSKPYENVVVDEPWIALVERGVCTFAKKIDQASAANATAIIVYDTKNGGATMEHKDANNIVSIIIGNDVGKSVAMRIQKGDKVRVTITRSTVYEYPDMRNKTSIIFVSLSFLILMIISLTWLIVYYVQRFRLIQAPDILKQRRSQAKKIIKTLPHKVLVEEDKELSNEEICPICIESYKKEDVLRILPCKHFFHRQCVDPWLKMKETCPMCKFDVLKACGLKSSLLDPTYIYGRRVDVPAVEIWDPYRDTDPAASTASTDSLVPTTGHESTVLVVIENNENELDIQQNQINQHRDVSETTSDLSVHNE